jgi:hypothetical protein
MLMVEFNVVLVPVDILETVELVNQEYPVEKDLVIKGFNVTILKMDSNAVHVHPDIMEMVNVVKEDEAVTAVRVTQVRDPDPY